MNFRFILAWRSDYRNIIQGNNNYKSPCQQFQKFISSINRCFFLIKSTGLFFQTLFHDEKDYDLCYDI